MFKKLLFEIEIQGNELTVFKFMDEVVRTRKKDGDIYEENSDY